MSADSTPWKLHKLFSPTDRFSQSSSAKRQTPAFFLGLLPVPLFLAVFLFFPPQGGPAARWKCESQVSPHPAPRLLSGGARRLAHLWPGWALGRPPRGGTAAPLSWGEGAGGRSCIQLACAWITPRAGFRLPLQSVLCVFQALTPALPGGQMLGLSWQTRCGNSYSIWMWMTAWLPLATPRPTYPLWWKERCPR